MFIKDDELLEFIEGTSSTDTLKARGKTAEERVIYYTLGMMGESGEFVDTLGEGTGRLREAGDAVWYWARLFDLTHPTEHFNRALVLQGLLADDPRKPCAIKTTEYPEITRAAQDRLELGMLVCASRTAEAVKRIIREPGTTFDETRRCILAWFASWASVCHITLRNPENVLKENRAKLAERKLKGKLHGSGSDR